MGAAVRQVFELVGLSVVIGLAGLAEPAALGAQPPLSAEQTAQVQQLLRELDAAQAARRNEAEKTLIELGPTILPLLPDDSQVSIEAQQRLTRIRARLTQAAAAQKAVKADLTVNLGAADTLTKALEAISRDSGIEFQCEQDGSRSITPYTSPLPFWNALDYVLDQAQLDIDPYGADAGEMALVARGPERPSRVDSAAYAGLYRLEPLLVTSRRTLRNAMLNGMSVDIELSWLPTTKPVGITLPLNQIVATLDDGAQVRAQQPDGSIDLAPSNDVALATLNVPLALPAGRPTKIVSLTGRIQSMLPGREKEFVFALKAGPQVRSEDFVTVRLEEVRKNSGLHELRIGVEYRNPGKALESHRGWLMGNQVQVELPDGSRQSHLGFELYRHNESGIGVGYLFDIGDSPDNVKLIYRTPTAILNEEIDFVIQDVPMP